MVLTRNQQRQLQTSQENPQPQKLEQQQETASAAHGPKLQDSRPKLVTQTVPTVQSEHRSIEPDISKRSEPTNTRGQAADKSQLARSGAQKSEAEPNRSTEQLVQSIERDNYAAKAGRSKGQASQASHEKKKKKQQQQQRRQRPRGIESQRVVELRDGKAKASKQKPGPTRKAVYTVGTPCPTPELPGFPIDDSVRIHSLFKSTGFFTRAQTWPYFVIGIHAVLAKLHETIKRPPDPTFTQKPTGEWETACKAIENSRFDVGVVFVERKDFSPLVLEQLCWLTAQASCRRSMELPNKDVRLVAFPDDQPSYVSIRKMLRLDHKKALLQEDIVEREMTTMAVSRHVVVDFPEAAELLDAVNETIPPLRLPWRDDLLKGVYASARAEEMLPSRLGRPADRNRDVVMRGCGS